MSNFTVIEELSSSGAYYVSIIHSSRGYLAHIDRSEAKELAQALMKFIGDDPDVDVLQDLHKFAVEMIKKRDRKKIIIKEKNHD